MSSISLIPAQPISPVPVTTQPPAVKPKDEKILALKFAPLFKPAKSVAMNNAFAYMIHLKVNIYEKESLIQHGIARSIILSCF